MRGNTTALHNIGCVFGSILVYFIGERPGRRTIPITAGAIMIIGAVVLADATNVAMHTVDRIVTGGGNSMISSTAAVCQSECSPANIRSALLTLQSTVRILDVVIAYWADYGKALY